MKWVRLIGGAVLLSLGVALACNVDWDRIGWYVFELYISFPGFKSKNIIFITFVFIKLIFFIVVPLISIPIVKYASFPGVIKWP